MGRFKKTCSNPLHKVWWPEIIVDQLKIPKYRYMKRMKELAESNGFESHKIRHICTKCLELVESKRYGKVSPSVDTSPSETLMEVEV